MLAQLFHLSFGQYLALALIAIAGLLVLATSVTCWFPSLHRSRTGILLGLSGSLLLFVVVVATSLVPTSFLPDPWRNIASYLISGSLALGALSVAIFLTSRRTPEEAHDCCDEAD